MRRIMVFVFGLVGALVSSTFLDAAERASVESLLTRIKGIGKEGAGNPEAAAAWKELTARKSEALLPILTAMDDDNLPASNWLRSAFDAVAERTVKNSLRLPAGNLERFIADTRKARCARRLAYEWLARVDGDIPGRLLPGMLLDPSPELRRDAVALVIKGAEEQLTKGNKDGARAEYKKALNGACDQDQVDAIAKKLKDLGNPVDLAAHFGMVRTWYLVAPFDNTDVKGFPVVYPPEKGVDLTAVYKGKNKTDVRWTEHTTTDPYGLVDLNKVLGKQKLVVAYAFAAIDSPAERLVQVRLGCINASKIFVNGEQVFAREEYHHGMKLDQYVGRAKLKAGRNEILLKICQNNQTESWAQDWKFQLRLTDFAGSAVPWKPVALKTARP